MKTARKLISLVLTMLIVIGSFGLTSIPSKAAEKTITIKASEVKTKKSAYYKYDSTKNLLDLYGEGANIVLDMDKDITFDEISTEDTNIPNALIIKGNKKLTVKSHINLHCAYTQETGSIVEITDGKLASEKEVTINSGATLSINDTGEVSGVYPTIISYEDMKTSGNITVNSSSYGIVCCENFIISGGDINVKAKWEGLFASKELNITGGNLNIYASDGAAILVSNGDLNISGGYIESSVGNVDAETNVHVSRTKKINVISPMYIKTPADYTDSVSYFGMDKVDANYIANADGTVPTKIIIANKAEEEEAARKAAEEAAAKKAAEEAAKKAAEEAAKNNAKKYSNEWVNGKWYNADGSQTYQGILEWKCNSTGWWVEDTTGWYPVSQWQKIDGKWYYFLDNGYMDYSEYRDGYWLGADGALVDGYYGEWKSDSKGWWFEDTSGWYPQSQWVWINGSCYYFEADGYLATNKYVDGYWVGADGACK